MEYKIITTRTEAKQISKSIHEWRKANIVGYSADSWANCNDSDSDFDAIYKHQTDELWYVPIDNENCLGLEDLVDKLPDGWGKEVADKITQ